MRVRCEIYLRLAKLGLGLLEVPHGAQMLCLQRRDLPLRERQVFQCRLHRRALLSQLRPIILGVLNGAPSVLRQLRVAIRLLLREDERRLRPINLCPVGLDLRHLDRDLRVDVLHARLGLVHGALGLADTDLVIGRINDHQQIALVHVFIVNDRQLDNVTGDLRRHGDDIGTNGAVTRPGRAHIGIPHRPPQQGRDRHDERGEQYRHDASFPLRRRGVSGSGNQAGPGSGCSAIVFALASTSDIAASPCHN